MAGAARRGAAVTVAGRANVLLCRSSSSSDFPSVLQGWLLEDRATCRRSVGRTDGRTDGESQTSLERLSRRSKEEARIQEQDVVGARLSSMRQKCVDVDFVRRLWHHLHSHSIIITNIIRAIEIHEALWCRWADGSWARSLGSFCLLRPMLNALLVEDRRCTRTQACG